MCETAHSAAASGQELHLRGALRRSAPSPEGPHLHSLPAGLDAGKVAGQRAYDEGKTAVLAGLAAGAGILLSQGPAVFAAASTWLWGIALPMTVAGIATHYLAYLRLSWSRFWQQRERDRSGPLYFWHSSAVVAM